MCAGGDARRSTALGTEIRQGMQYAIPSLRALYSKSYDNRMREWRRIGSVEKAENIVKLFAKCNIRTPVASALEVGCGTGDVLAQLSQRNMAMQYTGIEISDERINGTAVCAKSQCIDLRSYDGQIIPFPDNSFEFVYATHVLEHVTNQRGFLHELRRVSSGLIYVEVPCELTFRTSQALLQKTLNIGHINSYTSESFALTLATAGLRIINICIFDRSFAAYRFTSSWPAAVLKLMIRRSLLRISHSLAPKLLTYHCGALCERTEKLDIS
ncbi:MAG: class I SAM-dependent methyltransferase [Geminicoccaceae bacterium]